MDHPDTQSLTVGADTSPCAMSDAAPSPLSVVAAVAVHAGTVLSGGDATKAAKIERSWLAALRAATPSPDEPWTDVWSLCYLPGMSAKDAQSYAVHDDGHVVGFDEESCRRRGESTTAWLARLT